MDTAISAGQAARTLRTSVPRVIRAIDRLGLRVERGPGGRVSLRAPDLQALRAHLGVTPEVADLSRSEARVLAALTRAPLGLGSARAVARRAGVSPTAAGKALRGLVGRGLVREERRPVAAGRAREAHIFRANPNAPGWGQLATALGDVVLPSPSAAPRAGSVPPRLRHLFWNFAPGQLAIGEHGPFVARRLLQSGDLEGLAWGAARLSPEDWEHAGRARGLDPSRVALARNLAAAAARPSLAGAGPFAVAGRAPGTLNGLFSKTRLQDLHADEVEPQHRVERTVDVAGSRSPAPATSSR